MRLKWVVEVNRFCALALAAGSALWLAGCQSTGSIAKMDGAPLDGALQPAALHMPAGQQVTPPQGFIGFCIRDRSDCEGGTDDPKPLALTAARWSELNEINDYVNRTIPQIEDRDNYGVAEYWSYPNARGGDCEDLALLKRKMLIERGWPEQDLLLTVVREWDGDGHAVLTVTTDRGDYVLDNKNWAIVAWNDAPYTWVKRQSPRRPYIWVDLDQESFRLAANEEVPPLGAPIPFLAALDKAKPATGVPPVTAAALRPGFADADAAAANARPLTEPSQTEQGPTAALAAR